MRKMPKVPKNRSELRLLLIDAFMAGCVHGYAVEHTGDVFEQEMLGALWWVGDISKEECAERMKEYFA